MKQFLLKKNGEFSRDLSLRITFHASKMKENWKQQKNITSFVALGQEYCGVNSIPLLLMPWILMLPTHKQPWYWACKMMTIHQIEIFSALLAICVGNSPVTGEFPTQRPVMQSFDVYFDLCLNKRWSRQLEGRWVETPSRPLWHHCDEDKWVLVCHVEGFPLPAASQYWEMIEMQIYFSCSYEVIQHQ